MGLGIYYQFGDDEMSFIFSNFSESRLKDLDPRLVRILRRALGYGIIDFKVVETYRSIEAQQEAFRQGNSQIDGIHKKGKHNYYPSLAVDIYPVPVDTKDNSRFYYLAGIIMAAAKEIDIHLTYGGDWDGDGEIKDNHFDDLVHFELEN